MRLDENQLAAFARLALDCVRREYPNKIAHVMDADSDARPPRSLTPVFYGCFDWHSAVHGHWMLARLARLLPDAPFASAARAALSRNLTVENLLAEALTFPRLAGRALSGLTGWRGCCNWRRNCGSGPMTRLCPGLRHSRRWSRPWFRAFVRGYRNYRILCGQANIRRRRLRWGCAWITRGWPQTLGLKIC